MIELKQVSFTYQGQEHDGLRDIDLTIADGECVLLCGRSGCGKTTITRLVNGLIPQFYQGELQGRVLVDGQEISSLPMYQIAAKVGSVFQNPRTQFFNVDTDSEIAFGIENEARPPRELAERVEQTTEDLRIQSLRGRNIFELSGGEKQKIAFASVYAMNPEIYLLDEPSSNLDMTSIQELREHLRLVKGQGKTILIAEHRLYYLMDIADRIVYLDRGEIKGIFTPEELRRLSQAQREQMGLRATDLMDVLPPPGHAPVRGSVLSLNDVSLRYKRRTILHGIGLSAGRGEVIGVVGHNGAGKTTFSRALCGLHKDCDGQFQWDGGPMERRDRLKQSYMVMQDVNYELFAESVEAECSFGIRNPDKALVDATLEELGLAPYRERHPNTLSGGQKQRVAVAVSMICGKDLLVFDEPTSGLDFDSMAQVAGLIRRLSDMGKVIFIVTHDFEFVCRTCSRVLHFDEGEMPDDVPVIMEALPKLRELFSVCFKWKGEVTDETEKSQPRGPAAPLGGGAEGLAVSGSLFVSGRRAVHCCPLYGDLSADGRRLHGTCTRELVVRIVAMIAAAVTLRFVLFGGSGVAAHKGAYGALFKVRCMVAEHMARAPLGALNERRTGDIKTVLNEDIEKLELFLAHNLPDLVCYLVGPVVVFAYLMTVNIPLALVSLVPLVLAVAVMGVMFRNTDDLMDRANRSISTLNSVMIEYINGMKLIKAYNMGSKSFQKFSSAIHEENAMWNETSRRMGPPYAAFVVIIECGMLLMVPLGGMFFLRGSLTASAFLLFLYVGSLYLTEIRPLQELGTNFANVLGAVTKAKEILDIPVYQGGSDFPETTTLNCGTCGFPMTARPTCCRAST